MRTTITTSIDGELKEKVMPIIQNKLNKSVSSVLTEAFEKILKENPVEVSQ